LLEIETDPAFCVVAFSDGKPDSTFPENALKSVHLDPLAPFSGKARDSLGPRVVVIGHDVKVLLVTGRNA